MKTPSLYFSFRILLILLVVIISYKACIASSIPKLYTYQHAVRIYNLLSLSSITTEQKTEITKIIDMYKSSGTRNEVIDAINSKATNLLNNTNKTQPQNTAFVADAKSVSEIMNFEASFINGLSTFLAGRFKEEILAIGIDQFFEKITKYQENCYFEKLFPLTFSQIQSLKTTGVYYSADLVYLNQLVQTDLSKLPDHVINNIECIVPDLANREKLIPLLILSQEIIGQINHPQNLPGLISSLNTSLTTKLAASDKICQYFDLLDCLSHAFLIKDNGDLKWMDPTELNLDQFDLSTLNVETIFLGLLFEQLCNSDLCTGFIGSKYSVSSALIKLNSCVRLINNFVRINDLMRDPQFKLQISTNPYIILNQLLSEIKNSVLTAEFITSETIIHDKKVFQLTESFIQLYAFIQQKDYYSALTTFILQFKPYLNMDDKLNKTLLMLGQFVQVKNDKDMEQLIRMYALPIGSSSIKRHSQSNLSINGYVGWTGGVETAFINNNEPQVKGNFGLAAPIGLSYTTCNGINTYFFSLLDLGTMVNQRLNNYTTSYNNLRIEHFLAPGLGIYYNCPKLPITAGLHINYIPNLRTIKYTNEQNATITENNASVLRINCSILIDIPLFTLHNKEKNN